MTRANILAIGILVLSFANSMSALAQEKPVMVHGAGGSSCGKYVEVYDAYRPFIDGNGNAGGIVGWQATANYWQYEEWIEGYIYGMDSRVYNARPLRSWDQAGMRVWIYNYCHKHPVDVLANAALAFFKELGGKLE
jgi:hypothetical protein